MTEDLSKLALEAVKYKKELNQTQKLRDIKTVNRKSKTRNSSYTINVDDGLFE